MNADFERTRKCVNHYRSIGLCPLPSRTDLKGPMLATYAQHYGPEPIPEIHYRIWNTTNVQIITGTKSPTERKIVVVDCDGPEAHDAWNRIITMTTRSIEGAWICRTGSGGYHYYFSLPATLPSCSGGLLWSLWDTWGADGNGQWVKHKEVRLLADNALVIAPPSIHVVTGERYSFVGGANPNRICLPAEAPEWLLALPRLANPRFKEPIVARVAEPRKEIRCPGSFFTREEVIYAVKDKLSVAKEWGLVTKSDSPNLSGWVCCFVPKREDPNYSRPSGSFHVEDGTLQDRKDLRSISLFDLGVLLGAYSTWQECRDDLGQRFIGPLEPKYRFSY